jgi:extradiol dioxygenase family protein
MATAERSNTTLEEFTTRPVFHLAFPVTDLAAARAFYAGVLGCPVGRSSANWIDFNFFGYQISAHLVSAAPAPAGVSDVDGQAIPVPHFGVIVGWEDWHRAVDHLTYVGIEFRVAPHVRFAGAAGEQATFFIRDPSGNVLEFKAFRNAGAVFQT